MSPADTLVSIEVKSLLEKMVEEMEIKNFKIDISEGSTRGDNCLGIIAKVVVKGIDKFDKNVTVNWIVKSAPQNEGFRSIMPIRAAYEREIYYYTTVYPELDKLQRERGALRPFKSIAKCHKTSLLNKEEALLLENMKEQGFVLTDRRVPLDLNHALLVIREYGKLHALSFALRDQKPEMFEMLAENLKESFMSVAKSDKFEMSIVCHCERVLKFLDPVEEKDVFQKFQSIRNNVMGTLWEVLKSETAGKHAVFGHGDSWLNNMLFKYEDSTKPTQLCLLDWQLSRNGSPALDLSYFIFTCTDKKLRDKYYDRILEEYYDSLSSFLTELGSDPNKLFPFDVLQNHMKIFSKYGIIMSVMILHLMLSEVEEIPDFAEILNSEVNMEEAICFESKNEEKYKIRARNVILDCYKLGYL